MIFTKKFIKLYILLLFLNINAQTFQSPDKNYDLNFLLENGKPTYQLSYKGKEIINKSHLGLQTNIANLFENFRLIETQKSSTNETWQPVLGEYKNINNHYNEVIFTLNQKEKNITLKIIFRLFDTGLAFRYEIPEQKNINYFELLEEKTQFSLTSDAKTFWIPGDFDSQEHIYQTTLFSEINTKKSNDSSIVVQNFASETAVQTPLMMKSQNEIYLNIFEAALDNYPVMHLNADTNNLKLNVLLASNTVGSKAFLRTNFKSPWRTIIASDDARKIISANQMILNLNEPCTIKETSWIKPMKYVGIWWELHLGLTTWDYAGSMSGQMKPTGKHGATTENTKKYIDFAAKHGFDGVLVEGWNVGWEDWFGKWKEDVFDFTTPYPDFNLEEINQYAKSKGVKMIMHHETSGSVANYERHLDRAIDLMKKYNYPAVKTGYVGKIIPRGEHHDGQTMVNHFHHVVKRMAENKLMINKHECSRPTGFHRTYPNFIAAEAARGNEFNAWSIGNPPAHETILPFTRLMGGAMDYTPGIFEIQLKKFNPNNDYQVHTTLSKQLALYVTMYSPLQMAADLPEHYEQHLDAFQFIKDVAMDWDDTKILEAEPGEFLTITRKTKGKDEWFLGAITGENSRKSTISLNFLNINTKYEATIYADAKNAHWKNNPKAYQITKKIVTSKDKLNIELVAGGGTAVSFKKIN